METKEMFELLRDDIKEVRREVKEVRREVKEVRREVREDIKLVRQEIVDTAQRIEARLDRRIDDLRQDIQASRIFKNGRLAVGVAIVVGAAVVGTFVLQLLEAIR